MTKKIKNTDIKKILSCIDDNKRCLAEKLISKAVFMEQTLEDLAVRINTEGAVITTTNGNGFDVLSEHPAQKSYNAMIGRYNAVMKTIIDMIPNGGGDNDELMDFLTGARK